MSTDCQAPALATDIDDGAFDVAASLGSSSFGRVPGQGPSLLERRRAATRAFLERVIPEALCPELAFAEDASGALRVHGIDRGAIRAQRAIKVLPGARWVRGSAGTDAGYWLVPLEISSDVDRVFAQLSAEIAKRTSALALVDALVCTHAAITLAAHGSHLGLRFPADTTANAIAKAAGFQWFQPNGQRSGAFVIDAAATTHAQVQAAIDEIAALFASYIVEPNSNQPGLSKSTAASFKAATPKDNTGKLLVKLRTIFSHDELTVLAEVNSGAHVDTSRAPRIAALSEDSFALAKAAVANVVHAHALAMQRDLAAAAQQRARHQ